MENQSDFKHRHNHLPELESLDNLTNKTILVWWEQGLGDTIQFSRYISMLTSLGAKVTFEVQKPLLSLFTNQTSYSVTSETENNSNFDFQVALLSLPKLFNTEIKNIPNPTALYIAPKKILKWNKKVKLSNKNLNVGLAISGNPNHKNDSNRSMSLSDLSPLLDCGNFFLIQKELNGIDINELNTNKNIKFLGDQINDFVDTASIIINMDLIISVDTSLIHLAGSLNKNSYLLLPWCPEWRWLLDRTDSPWYPSIKIFRQQSLGSWDSVIQDIKNNLLNLTYK